MGRLFFREGDGALGGRNEFYSYIPDLADPDQEIVAILKGTLINRSKKIIETWKTSRAGIKIRVLAYYLRGVDPPGVYYTFQSYDAEWSEWESVMTFRQEEPVPIPGNSVEFINDATAYVIMGSLYAVTTDSGKHWSVWDAERDYEAGRWCGHWLIRSVEIGASGDGTIVLSPGTKLAETWSLRTSDYGQHWKSL